MRDARLQLLPEHPYSVWIQDGDGESFVEIFRSVWNELPSDVVQRLIEYWSTEPTGHGPYFELSEMWVPKGSAGQVKLNGYQMKFRTSAFAAYPRPASRWVVAHELGHVWQWIEGRDRSSYSLDENEEDADLIAMRWGFCNMCRNRVAVEINNGLSFEEACDAVRDEPWCR